MITPTIDVGELIWILAAIPGLWFWVRNRLEAGIDAKAAATIVPRNGRYLWARFSVFLTNTFVGIELLFLLLGGVALFRPPPMDPQPGTRVVTIAGLTIASVVITLLAYRWKQVNEEIVRAARARTHPAERELPPVAPPPEN